MPAEAKFERGSNFCFCQNCSHPASASAGSEKKSKKLEGEMFDIVIVGSGPAGLTSAIYAKRAGKKVVVIEKAIEGGQVATIGKIENYPGFAQIDGFELADNFVRQAKSLGVEFVQDEMIDLKFEGDKNIVIGNKSNYEGKAIILALGSVSRKLKVEGEDKYLGKGVSYCATCDGNFFRNKNVVVVGSGDSAVSSALYLLPICKTVSIVSKYPELKLKGYSKDILNKLNGVKIYYNSNIERIEGDDFVEKVKIDSMEKEVSTDGVFVSIGRMPTTEFLLGKIELDEKGYIKVDNLMHTSRRGVYACGDITNNTVKQIVTATAEGAIASVQALKDMQK